MNTRNPIHIRFRQEKTLALFIIVALTILLFGINQPSIADEQVRASKGSDLILNPYHRVEEFGGEPGLQSAIANMHDDQKSDELRYWSAVVVGQSGDQRSLATLLVALKDSNESVRAGALVGLKFMRDPRAIPKLTNVLEYDASPSVRQLALVTLVKTPDDSVGDILVRNASSLLQQNDLRISAIQGIEYINLEGAADKLRPLLQDKNPDIKALVAIYLSRSEPHASVSHLVGAALSYDTRYIVRADAILRLQEITGEDFGLGDETHRRDPIRMQVGRARNKVHSWWSENKTTFREPK